MILVKTGYTNFVIYFLLTCGFLIWQKSFSYKDVAACFENFLILHRSLMDCNIIFKCGSDSLMFQNSFFTKIPYSSYPYKEIRVGGI
jgi:hypothetical protein